MPHRQQIVYSTINSMITFAKKGQYICFWKAWRKRFYVQNLKPTGVLNGKSGDNNVRAEFTNYYKSVFQPYTQNADAPYKVEYLPLVDLEIMNNCVSNLGNNKAPGHDGICGEHIQYAGAHLSLSFI